MIYMSLRRLSNKFNLYNWLVATKIFLQSWNYNCRNFTGPLMEEMPTESSCRDVVKSKQNVVKTC